MRKPPGLEYILVLSSVPKISFFSGENFHKKPITGPWIPVFGHFKNQIQVLIVDTTRSAKRIKSVIPHVVLVADGKVFPPIYSDSATIAKFIDSAILCVCVFLIAQKCGTIHHLNPLPI